MSVAMSGQPIQANELILDRFCGRERHPIIRATWNIYDDKELRMGNLCLSLQAGKGVSLSDDTAYLKAEPSWEVNVLEQNLTEPRLVTGVQFCVPDGYDDDRGGHLTNFYYCEHEATENNTVKILAAENTRLLIRMTGETTDVNYYDGSKPPTKLLVETWFVRDARTMSSIM